MIDRWNTGDRMIIESAFVGIQWAESYKRNQPIVVESNRLFNAVSLLLIFLFIIKTK